MFQRYEVVTNAAREAARLGVLRQSGGYGTEDEAEVLAGQRALNYLAVSGVGVGGTLRPAPCGQTKVANSRCVDIRWGTADLGGTPPRIVNEVTAVVEYDHEHIFVGPITRLFGGSMAITRVTAVSTMRLE